MAAGGAVTGAAGQTTLKDTKTGTVLTRRSSATRATLKKGRGQANPIGKITPVTFSGCTGPGGLRFAARASASGADRWKLAAGSFQERRDRGTISGVTAALSGNGCTAMVAGAGARSPGRVTGSYRNRTHVLSVSGGNLHVWNASSGRLGLIKTGDPARGPPGSHAGERPVCSPHSSGLVPPVVKTLSFFPQWRWSLWIGSICRVRASQLPSWLPVIKMISS